MLFFTQCDDQNYYILKKILLFIIYLWDKINFEI